MAADPIEGIIDHCTRPAHRGEAAMRELKQMGPLTLRLAALACLGMLLGACLDASTVTCIDGRICPPGTSCDDTHGGCVGPDQPETCIGKNNGDPCLIASTTDGVCHDEVCLREGCGDLFVSGLEQCDGVP